MRASRSIACVVVSVFFATSAWATDGIDQKVASTHGVAKIPAAAVGSVDGAAYPLSPEEKGHSQPWIHTRMDDGLRARVEAAYEIASQRVQESEACAELFSEFEVDATQTLGSVLYWPVLSYRDRTELCGRKNLAFTFVGSTLTFICPDFEEVSDQRAAQIIIHEALHNAGLKEKPQYKGVGVKTPAAIDSMVAKACNF